MKLLFVCLGNICRSPAAEAIMNKLLADQGLSSTISCDSAGTSAYHHGEPADRRMAQALRQHGYTTTSTSRPIDPARDYDDFDYILAMDKQNLHNLQLIQPSRPYKAKMHLICEFSTNSSTSEIPDPYYQGDEGFHSVIELLEEACAGLLATVIKEHQLQ